MNRMLALLVVVCAMSSASAGTITLDLSTNTDGYRYSYSVYGDVDPEWIQEEIGVLHLDESIDFDWTVAYLNGPHVHHSSIRTLSTLGTIFNPSSQIVADGLLSPGLNPSFTPDTESVNAEVSGEMRWIDFVDPARMDRGGVQFNLALYWGASLIDELGTIHVFNYSRSYSFFNNTLISSADELAVFSEAFFMELLASPATQTSFVEDVAEWNYTCDIDGVCSTGDSWGYRLEGTFDVSAHTAVAEPYALTLFGVGGLMAFFGSRRRAVSH